MTFRKLLLGFALAGSVALAAATPAAATALEAIVDRHAAAQGVPKDFARAIVRVESGWNAKLTGAAGEVGLMQIKHETARFMGYAGSRTQLYEPDTNVKWGMKYLADAWKLAQGDHCGTVLRYQAGLQAKTMTGAARAYCARLRQALAAVN
jgi:soluble lytic murein transglycosylase-like protein